MVCSSTLRASPVIHSVKRRKPGVVKAAAQGWSRSCQWDQSSVACMSTSRVGERRRIDYRHPLHGWCFRPQMLPLPIYTGGHSHVRKWKKLLYINDTINNLTLTNGYTWLSGNNADGA